MTQNLPKALTAGAAYFAMIFALGFALGTLRVLWLAPMVGETWAVLAEQPIILTASWFAAGWLVRQNRLETLAERASMGGFALILLFVAEVVLGVTLFEQSPGQSLADALVVPGLIGQAGQIVFGLMPIWVRERR